MIRSQPRHEPVDVFENDSTQYRVIWREDSGRYRRSKAVLNYDEARIAANRHPEWPWAIVQENTYTIVVARG
jgi:hypothetical protein